MKSVGTYEAKTRLSELIAQVNQDGENLAITNHGNIVAMLTPPPKATVRAGNFDAAMQKWLETRDQVRLNGLNVRELINEGRR